MSQLFRIIVSVSLHLKLPMISIWILLVLQIQQLNWKLILGLDSPFSVIFRLSDSEVDNANALWKLFVLLDCNYHIERLFPMSHHMYQNNTQRFNMGGSSVILGLLFPASKGRPIYHVEKFAKGRGICIHCLIYCGSRYFWIKKTSNDTNHKCVCVWCLMFKCLTMWWWQW